MAKNNAFSSGMRGGEKEHAYHPNQNPETSVNKPEGEQAGAVVGGVSETPKVFSSGMRGSEKYSPSTSTETKGQNALESQVDNQGADSALKGLPPGAEIIGGNKTHHIVKVPIGKGANKAVPS